MTPEFLYDFGSPNAYLAWRALPGVEERTGARFARVPVLLGGIFKATGNQSPFMTYAHVRGRLAYEQLEMQRFMAKHGITEFRFNPHFPQNSLLMMRGAVAADAGGQGDAYRAACFRGMWEEGVRMDDPDALAAHLDAAGLDGARLLKEARTADVKAKLTELTNHAVERGVFGLPSFLVGDALYFGKDRLGEVELELLRGEAGEEGRPGPT